MARFESAMDDDMNFQIDDGELDLNEHWVELPGMHPVLMSEKLIKDNWLWDYVVNDRKIRLQIQR